MQAPLAPTAAQSEWALPALGALALVGAWLAALGGVVDGAISLNYVVNIDTVRPHLIFRDLFTEDGFPFSGWRQGDAPFYFPDNFLLWPFFGLGAGLVFALCLFPLAQSAFAAVGWILVCDFLYGKSPVRRFAVLALHAACFLTLAWRGGDVHFSLIVWGWHYGAWAAAPWLLWLSLRLLSGPGAPGAAAALAAVLAATVASDLLIVPWFVAPAALSVVLLSGKGGFNRRACFAFFAALAVGVVVGRALFHLVPDIKGASPAALNLEKFGFAVRATVQNHWAIVSRNPAEALLWAAFAFVALRRAAAVFRPGARRNLPPTLALSPGGAGKFMALFVPAAMLFALFAPLATGTVISFAEIAGESGDFVGRHNRYSLPFLLFPLFVGWALLPGAGLPRAKSAAVGVFAALLLASAPKAARVDFAALDPFNTPFHQCVAENARRLNWRGGISTPFIGLMLVENSAASVLRMLPIGVFRRPQAGQSFMVVDSPASNRHRFNGEFQFVVVNFLNQRAFYDAPLPGEDGDLFQPDLANYLLDPETARAAFGEPREEIDCAGIGLFHYDPPLKFDFSHLENPYLAPVARW